MKINILCRTRVMIAAPILILAILSACAKPPPPIAIVAGAPTKPAGSPAPEVIVYASDLTTEALDELDFIEEVASPGGVMIGLPNSGDELDPPPESDPHVTFLVPVKSGVPYRCWIHMKVGEAKGRSTANIAYVQFSKSVDRANHEVFRLSTNSYLTAQGPTQPGWTWVSCDREDGTSLIYFENSGETRVRIQAGAEGVGFDQFLLSPAKFLEASPAEAVLLK